MCDSPTSGIRYQAYGYESKLYATSATSSVLRRNLSPESCHNRRNYTWTRHNAYFAMRGVEGKGIMLAAAGDGRRWNAC